MYDGVSSSQVIAHYSQAPTSSPRHLDPTTVAAPEARRTRRALSPVTLPPASLALPPSSQALLPRRVQTPCP